MSSTVVSKLQDFCFEFDRISDRVYLFFGKVLNDNKAYGSFWKVCKILFTLSRGQSAVERSFSVNKDFLVENLKKQSLCAQRMVYNHLQTECNTLHEFKIEKEPVVSAKSARSSN